MSYLGGVMMGGEFEGGELMGGEFEGGAGVPLAKRSHEALVRHAKRMGHSDAAIYKKDGMPKAHSTLLKLLTKPKKAAKKAKKAPAAKKVKKVAVAKRSEVKHLEDAKKLITSVIKVLKK